MERCGLFHTTVSNIITNSLVGVLIHFRQDPVAMVGDVQSMFHQVCIPEEDRDLLLWPKGDFTKKLEDYRLTIHLFGAVSLPSCANFAMRQNAEDHKHEFSPNVVNTILRAASPKYQLDLEIAKLQKYCLSSTNQKLFFNTIFSF